jgi:hypothetical protein
MQDVSYWHCSVTNLLTSNFHGVILSSHVCYIACHTNSSTQIPNKGMDSEIHWDQKL